MTTFKVGYLIGSLAKGSINRKLATELSNRPFKTALRSVSRCVSLRR
jgi:NAD(P)H-dependent FMN reductase